VAKKKILLSESPQAGQVLSATLLILLAWLPLIADLKAGVNAYVGFLMALRLASLRWSGLAPGRWVLLPLMLAGLVIVLGSYHTIAGPEAGTALLTTMLSLKLLEICRVRDLRLITILFGFLLVSQFFLDDSALRTFYLSLLVVLDFALMGDLAERSGHGRQALAVAARRAGRLSAQALPLALALFFLFPRLSAPLWSVPGSESKGQTGMSDWMEPGSIGEVVLSAEPAFRVRFQGPVPSTDKLYWRGPVTWHTDGRRWTGWPLEAPVKKAEKLVETGDEIAYRVAYQMKLKPGDQPWLFALDMPVQAPRHARILGDYQVLTTEPVKYNQSIRLVSALEYNTGQLDLDQELAGTQLPDNVTPRMRALVADWQKDAGSQEDLVRSALAFFRKKPFYYTLFPPKLGPNPTDEFLFETRRGFCEHYAGSFALLMRIAGIPSRVVLGYLGGELNTLGDYLLVRQSDAHAWAEVWLEGRGWVRIDPTAAIAPERVEYSDLLERLGAGAPLRFRSEDVDALIDWIHDLALLKDAIETGWYDWVVELSSTRQHQLLESLGLGPLREYGFAVALIVAVGLVLGLLFMAMTRISGTRDPLEKLYARFCSRLSRIGLQRRNREGPLDYSRRVMAVRPDLRDPVMSFMALYLPQRYGAGNGTAGRRALQDRLRRFRPHRHPRG
jgi:transglutaminase-like putative cysteine protease